MEDSPLTGDLYVYALGYFPKAAHHHIERPEGRNEYILIYCTEDTGKIELYGKKELLKERQFITSCPKASHTVISLMRGILGTYIGCILKEARH